MNSKDFLSDDERVQLPALSGTHLAFFRMDVLAQYRSNSHKYAVETSDFEGEVQISDSFAEECHSRGEDVPDPIHVRFGYRRLNSGEYGLAVFKPDFNQYSQEHLPRWLPHMVHRDDLAPLPDVRFEMWSARHLFGSWEVDNNIIEQIKEDVKLINAVAVEALGRELFLWPKNEHLGTPISENDLAYQDAHRELYGFLLGGLDKDSVSALLARTTGVSTGSDKQTRKRLESSVPGIAGSTLWASLDNVSVQRGLAAHKVRPPAKPFKAFEALIDDLMQIHGGLKDLLGELCAIFGIDPEQAVKRREAERHLTGIERPMQNEYGMHGLLRAVGKTIERIDYGLRKEDDELHRSDVVHIHFTDGSIVSMETGSNAQNVAGVHEGLIPRDFNTCFYTFFVPPPQVP